MSNFHLYHDNVSQADLPPIAVNDKLNDPNLYVPSKGLMSAVNVALQLGQPLLLTGEPGTGKTQLAYHIAHFFKLGKPLIFNAQTTSQAKDLFYRYDALAHFQFAQTKIQSSTTEVSQTEFLKPDEVEKRFIRYHGLGTAIRTDVKAVVLLDEIDKAPRDLPNDILAAIEDLRFEVPEIGKVYTASSANRPIIIMTSNSEKNLPDAFLRRVVYYNIPFPDSATLLRIVSSKIGGYTEEGLKALIAHFEEIRGGKIARMRKNPATAELINWVALLHKAGFDASKIDNTDDLSAAERETLIMSYSVLAKNRDDLKDIRKML
jgi:MoxR-like ATPase